MTVLQNGILPILCYGIEIILSHLSKSNFATIKAMYLKKVLGVSKTSSSRLIYKMTREPFLIEELRMQLLLPSMSAWEETMKSQQAKKKRI